MQKSSANVSKLKLTLYFKNYTAQVNENYNRHVRPIEAANSQPVCVCQLQSPWLALQGPRFTNVSKRNGYKGPILRSEFS
jgi:hypothetical protein